MYHAGWAWAGSTPFRSTKLVAAHLGGTRNPMVVSWPKGIKPDKAMRSQFHHVTDIAPTLYEILGITPPKVVNGIDQLAIDGKRLAYTFTEGGDESKKDIQFFDNNGSRAIYKDGWMACAFGPFIPWNTPASAPRIAKCDSATDEWALYHVAEDFSQAKDLAAENPEKLAELKTEFLKLAEDNKGFPIGAGNWLRLHPEDRVKTPYSSWTFTANTRRMPEFTAPGLGRESNTVEIDMESGANASGVLYALGGSGGGLALYMDKGRLVYLYNMMIIEQYEARGEKPLAAGKHKITVKTTIAGPGKPGTVMLIVDGAEVGQAELKRTVPAAYTASESFDVGCDLGSTVANNYFDRRRFRFDGKIAKVEVNFVGGLAVHHHVADLQLGEFLLVRAPCFYKRRRLHRRRALRGDTDHRMIRVHPQPNCG
jgi:arylsulfatase